MSDQESTLDEFVGESTEGKNSKKENKDETVKHSRFGSLPSNWRVEELSEITDVVGGSTPSTSNDAYWGGGIQWATPTDISGLSSNTISETADTLTQEGLESTSTHLIPPNSVLMTSRATIGECAVNTVEMATNQGFKNFVPGEDIETWYLHYRMQKMKSFLESLGSGSTFNEVSKSVVKSVEIPVPPLPEQRKIATLIWNIDKAIEKTTEIVDQLANVKQGTAQDIFNNGAFQHDSYQNTIVGDFPDSWDLKKLADLVDLRNGLNFSGEQKGDGTLLANVQNVYGTINIVPSELSRVNISESEIEKYRLQQGDIITVRSSVDADGVGQVAIYRGSEEPVVFAGFTIRQRPKPGCINPEYLVQYLRYPETRKRVVALGGEVALTNISQGDLKKIEVPVPSDNEQKEIVKILDSFDQRISIEKEQVKKLRNIKQGLMQDLFSGTVRTTDTNITVPDEVAQHG